MPCLLLIGIDPPLREQRIKGDKLLADDPPQPCMGVDEAVGPQRDEKVVLRRAGPGQQDIAAPDPAGAALQPVHPGKLHPPRDAAVA